MRRKRKKKHLTLSVASLIIVFMTAVSFGYSYLSLSLKISGHIKGQITEEEYTLLSGSDPNLSINVSKMNTWQDNNKYNYQYSIKITNVGMEKIDGFEITIGYAMKMDGVIISDYSNKIIGKTLIITNDNNTLFSGQSVTINFVIMTTAPNQKISNILLESIENRSEVTLDEFNVNFVIIKGWEQYKYQYNVTVINKTGFKINAWQLVITLPAGTTFDSASNVVATSTENILTISNGSSNGALNKNESTTFALQLSTNIINFIPSNIKVTVR